MIASLNSQKLWVLALLSALLYLSTVGVSDLIAQDTEVDALDVDPFADTFGDQPVVSIDTAEEGTAEGGIAENGTGVAGDGGEEQTPQQKTPEEVLQEAQQHMENEEWAEAVQKFSSILAVSPRYVPGYVMRGRALAQLEEIDLALQSLSQAVIYGSQFPDVFIERGKLYLETRQYREAVDDFEQAVQLQPANGELQFLRGKAQSRLAQELGASGGLTAAGLHDTAMKALDRAILLDEDYAEAYAERANVHLSLGDADAAVEDLGRATEIEPDNAQFVARLALVYSRRAESEDAAREPDEDQLREDYRNAISAFHEYLAIAEELGLLEQDADPPEDPEDILPERAILGLSSAQINLADKTDDPELFHDAVQSCNRAIELQPQLPTAFYQRGVAQRMLTDLPAAVDSFSEAIDISPEFSEARLRRGIAWYHMGEFDLALGDFERAADSRDGRGSFWAGATLAKQGEFVEAVQQYSNAIQQNALYKPAYNNRGLAFMKLGLFEQAAKDFRTLLRMNPNNSVARQRRDLALHQMQLQ